MKKLFLYIVLTLFLSNNSALANERTSLYIIKNTTPKPVIQDLYNKLEKPNKDINNNIIYSTDRKYYIKTYQSYQNTELYLLSKGDSTKDIDNAIKKLKYKTFSINDKASLKQYRSDFENYSKNKNLSFVKIKNTKSGNSQGYKNYKPYNRRLTNTVLATKKLSQNNIVITRNTLEPKGKIAKIANEYEYIIKNNTNRDIVINKVTSLNFLSYNQAEAYLMIPQGKNFIPFYGFVYDMQAEVEKGKFTRPMPQNETIKRGTTMRVLALSKKGVTPTADFYFTSAGQKIKFTFR